MMRTRKAVQTHLLSIGTIIRTLSMKLSVPFFLIQFHNGVYHRLDISILSHIRSSKEDSIGHHCTVDLQYAVFRIVQHNHHASHYRVIR